MESEKEEKVMTTDMSESIGSIAMALSKAQAKMSAATKDSSGYGYKYSDLSTVIAAAKDILAENELAVVQLVGHSDDSVRLTTILTHSSGEFFKSVASIPVVDMKSVNSAQRAGASLSYLRRYAYQAIIGQPSDDNDASSKEKTPKPTKAYTAPAKTASKPSTETKAPAKTGGSFRKNAAPKVETPAVGGDDDL